MSCVAHHDYIPGLRTSPSYTAGLVVPSGSTHLYSTMHTSTAEITLSDPQAWHASAMPPPTSTEGNIDIAPWSDPPSPPPKRSNFSFTSVRVLNRQASSSNVFPLPGASESITESCHSASTSDSQRPSNTAISKGFLKVIKRSLSRPNLNKHSYDVPPIPPPTVAFPHDISPTHSNHSLPPLPSPAKKTRRYHKQKSNATPAPPSMDLLPGLPDGASMERILNVPVRDIVHPSALREGSYGSLTSTDTASSPIFEDSEAGWTSRFSNDLVTPAFTNPFPIPTNSSASLVSRRKVLPEPSRVPQTAALLPVAQEPQKPRRLGSGESTAASDDPASWRAPESWAVPREGDEPEAPDYSEDEESHTSSLNDSLLSPETKNKKGGQEGKAPLPPRKGSQGKAHSIPVCLIFIPQR